jgi:hypothetical protein
VITPIPIDVPPESVMIDKVLRSMLEREGIDLHAVAEALIRVGFYHDSIQGEMRYAWEQIDGDIYELTQDGLEPPVMSGWTTVGDACFHGDHLYVRELLPQTICASAVGRRLGDVVSTGMPELDSRTLLQVFTCEDQALPAAATRFVFAPDLVELGRPPTSSHVYRKACHERRHPPREC